MPSPTLWRAFTLDRLLVALLAVSAAFTALAVRGLELRGEALALLGATCALLLLVIARRAGGLRRRLQAAEARIRELTLTDELTGLANRRHLRDRLVGEWQRALRYRRPFSVALLDLDRFKAVNDTLGHDAGDAVLRAVSQALAARLRASDLVGRWGGEELLVLMPETDSEGAQVVVERLRGLVEALTIDHAGLSLNVTVSAGTATVTPRPGEQDDLEALLERAEQALHRAKDQGRNRVAV